MPVTAIINAQYFRPNFSLLDLRRIVRSGGELARARTVLSEGEVLVDTSREEKPFAAELIRSGDERALRKSSLQPDNCHISATTPDQKETADVLWSNVCNI